MNQQPKKKTKTIWKILIGTVGIFVLIGIIGVVIGDESGTAEVKGTSTSDKIIRKGETLHTQYFDVTINKASIQNDVRTGNEFADLPKEAGNKYVVILLTLKNTDTESRLMFDGVLKVENNGKEYNYEQAEVVAADGFGITDNINPGVTKTTKVVYKVPADIKGKFWYEPGRGEGKLALFKID